MGCGRGRVYNMIRMTGNRGLKRLTKVEADLTSWWANSRLTGSVEHNVGNSASGGSRVPGAPLLILGSDYFEGRQYSPIAGNSYVNLAGCNARWNNRAKYRLGLAHVYQIYSIRLYKGGSLAVAMTPNYITGYGATHAGIDFDPSDYTASYAPVSAADGYPKSAVGL